MRTQSVKAMKKRERILVVDDDASARESMAEALTEAGFVVASAGDGYEALWLAARRAHDVVVTDVSMPGIDGVELTRRLHAFARHVPVILTTGLAETRDLLTSAADYGAVACLQKPMNLDELVWTIERAIAVQLGGGHLADLAPLTVHRPAP
jgi:two-component system response regulator HydG